MLSMYREILGVVVRVEKYTLTRPVRTRELVVRFAPANQASAVDPAEKLTTPAAIDETQAHEPHRRIEVR
jgi:hypothetical protein